MGFPKYGETAVLYKVCIYWIKRRQDQCRICGRQRSQTTGWVSGQWRGSRSAGDPRRSNWKGGEEQTPEASAVNGEGNESDEALGETDEGLLEHAMNTGILTNDDRVKFSVRVSRESRVADSSWNKICALPTRRRQNHRTARVDVLLFYLSFACAYFAPQLEYTTDHAVLPSILSMTSLDKIV